MTPVSTPAILLRSHDYGDSSRILRFYTREHGLLSVVARGVRGRSGKGGTTLATFASGELSAYVKPQRDLHTMKDFQCRTLREGLAAGILRLSGASAVCELVLAHAEQEPEPGVFDALEGALDELLAAPDDRLPGTVLTALWTITGSFGFAPQLDPCVRCARPLGPDAIGRMDFAAGGMRCAACAEGAAGPRVGPVARGQLAALIAGEIPDGLDHPRRHLGLVTDFVAHHVVSRPLRSLRFVGSAMPEDEAIVDA